MRPRIAIPEAHSNRDYTKKVMPQYAHAIELAEGEAVTIPLYLDNTEVMRLVTSCHAVLLPGSRADVNPQKYEQARDCRTHDSDPARDNVDELLLQDAYNMQKPILGICFGMQILNVWRTGTLVQHLETPVPHAGNSDVRHEIRVDPESRLMTIMAEAGTNKTFAVNTSHHQAVAVPGDGLKVVAWCNSDEVVEALEGSSRNHFVVGVQWHPERLVEDPDPAVRTPARALFAALVEAARAHRKREHTADFETFSHP